MQRRETLECREMVEGGRRWNFGLVTQPQDSVRKGRATTGMNVSFISFYEITPSFNSVELVSSRHRDGARNENAVFANRDKYGHGFACTENVYVQRVNACSGIFLFR